MNVFDRLSNGWTIAMNSFKVLKEKKELVVFPILSRFSILLVVGSFFVFFRPDTNWGNDEGQISNSSAYWLLVFLFYLVNYFVVIFFNMALVHCTRLYFRGEEFTIRDGLAF